MQQSEVVALLLPQGESEAQVHPEHAAVLVVRRADGQIALAPIDVRLARARLAASAGQFGKR
jgi:hypothetical protein